MAGFSDTLANITADAVLGSGTPATVYVSLHTGAPGGAGANECSGNGYARVAMTNNTTNWPAAVGPLKSNGTAVTFPTATGGGAGFGTATHWGVWGASSGGTFYYYGTLTASQAIPSGVTASFGVGELDLNFS